MKIINMKQLYTIFAMTWLFSCSSGSEGGADYGSMTFHFDTVVVNAGEEIINLKNGMWLSTVSRDKKLLYNFDRDQTLLEKINLDRLVLEEKIPFEKEGPNGTGMYVSNIQMDQENNFQFSSWDSRGIFNQQGEKLKEYKISKEAFSGDQWKDAENFASDFVVAEDKKTLIGLLASWNEKGYALGVLDYEAKTFRRYELEEFGRTQDYHIMLKMDNAMSIRAQSVKIQEHQGKYLVTNSIFNTMALYDPATDSLSYIKYDNKLTANSKTGKYRNEVESQEEFRREISAMDQEVNFQPPLWDEQKKLFYRFCYKQKPMDDNAEPNTPAKGEVFLTILDESFNVLGESKVDALTTRPASPFVKDGKIWLYENIDDELGFVRLAIEF
jgi:hypothetical protein